MTEEQLQQLAADNGGLVGEPYQITAPDPLTGKPTPTGTLRYTFKKGTYIVLKPRASTGSDATGTTYDVVNGGTALKQPAAPKSSRAQTQTVDGVTYERDPATGTWHTAQGIPASTSVAAKLTIAQQRADADTSRAGTAQQNADTARTRADTAATTAQARAKEAADKQAGLDWYHQRTAAITEEAVQGKISTAEAMAQITETHQEVSEWLTQRAQDLTFAEGMARDTTTAMDAAISHLVPISTLNGINQAQGQIAKQAGMPFTPEQPTPFPYDPRSAASQIALRALAQISPAAAAAAGGDPRQAVAAAASGTSPGGTSFSVPPVTAASAPTGPVFGQRAGYPQ